MYGVKVIGTSGNSKYVEIQNQEANIRLVWFRLVMCSSPFCPDVPRRLDGPYVPP